MFWKLTNSQGRRRLSWLVATSFVCAVSTAFAGQPNAPNDQQISDKVDDELLMDHAVIATKVDVNTQQGIVTLRGTVNNILAKQRAVRIAETVKGVRAVVNQINVQPSALREDANVHKDVDQALLTDPATDAYEVTTTVKDGTVTLAGTVDSYQERDLVAQVTKGVRGVRDIKNNIKVRVKTDRSDSEIQQEIEQALKRNVLIDNAMVGVEVKDGKVALDGIVGSAAEKTQAAFTSWVAGVQSVDDSELNVEKWMRDDELRGTKYVFKSDQEIRRAVEDAMLYDPRVNSFNVDTEVATGTVTLRGIVDNLKAKRAAAKDARNTVGVARVKNRIKVRPSPQPEDDQIAQDIRAGLRRNPLVSRYDVTVSVTDGTAYLYGSVDSYLEKFEVDDVVSRVNGVADVRNRLTVLDVQPFVYDPYLDPYPYDFDWYNYQPTYTSKPDIDIKEDIESEMWWSPFVDADEVTVSVDDGTATLTGTVDTWNERSSATENAYEGGATWVDNDLDVSTTN